MKMQFLLLYYLFRTNLIVKHIIFIQEPTQGYLSVKIYEYRWNKRMDAFKQFKLKILTSYLQPLFKELSCYIT